MIFVHLRDREGVTQIVFREDAEPSVHQKAELVRSEYVIAVEGEVALRTAETVTRISRPAKWSGRGQGLDPE